MADKVQKWRERKRRTVPKSEACEGMYAREWWLQVGFERARERGREVRYGRRNRRMSMRGIRIKM